MRSIIIAATLALLPVIGAAQSIPTWRLVEEWRVGGAIDGPHSFSKVVAIRPLADGRIAVLEGKDQQLHILGAKGEPIKTVGRRGSGPGEFREARGLIVAPSGEIVVSDVANARLTFISPTGDFARTVLLPPFGPVRSWDAYYDAQGRLVEQYRDVRRVWNADYTRVDTATHAVCANIPVPATNDIYYRVYSGRGYMSTSYPFTNAGMNTVNGGDGYRWIGELPDFRMIRRVAFGSCTVAATATLTGPLVQVPGRMYSAMRAMIGRSAEGQTGPDAPNPDKVRRTLPAIESLTIDATNRLWVERLTPQQVTFDTLTRWAHGPSRFDVFSTAGVPLATVAVPAGVKTPRHSGVIAITGDRFYAFVPDADDVLYLTAYRIVRN